MRAQFTATLVNVNCMPELIPAVSLFKEKLNSRDNQAKSAKNYCGWPN